jgi:hypothetical protein
MADLTVTAANVSMAFPDKAITFDVIAGATITQGQPIYIDSNGVAQLADASLTGTAQVRGISMSNVRSGQVLSVIKEGWLEGMGVSGLAYDARVYLSDTVGVLADAVGTVGVTIGRVLPATDNSKTKLLYVDLDFLSQFT